MDLLAGFLEQCIEIDYSSDYSIMASDLFALYSKWAKKNNEYEMTSKKFFREITKKLPEKGRSTAATAEKGPDRDRQRGAGAIRVQSCRGL